jgi:NosR/NirI family transcriptional regulator, nitrous oxide reductase regulator
MASSSLKGFIGALFAPKRPEPSYPLLPEADDKGATTVRGIYVAGEIAGTPLVKLGLNQGHQLVHHLAAELKTEHNAEHNAENNGAGLLDIVIVGSGSSGLGATVAAADLGLSYVTLEADKFANTFVTMTKGKLLLAEPNEVKKESRVWFEECTKEELLKAWRDMVAKEKLDVREQTRVSDISGSVGNFKIKTNGESFRARRVLLCLGKAGNPRKLGIPGEKEHAAKVHHRLLDPDDYLNNDIVIVGGGDVACEAAIALCNAGKNRVTLSAIDEEFTYPKKRNIEAVRQLEADDKLRIILSSAVKRIEADSVEVELKDGNVESIRNDTVFEMIGAELPIRFLRKVGIRLAGDWYPARWLGLLAAFIFVYSLYALKSYGKGLVAWPYQSLIRAESYDWALLGLFKGAFAIFAPFFSNDALTQIYADRGFQQGYLYSLLYTVAMLVFGYVALVRWRSKASDKRYQTYRYITLLSFQLAFFLIVNVIGVQALSVKYAWRAWGLYQPFPLFFNTFFWWYPSDSNAIKYLFISSGLVGTFLIIPLLARYHGKRFCTWVCGCGGLAETLGDRWRHLAAKGTRSRAWEFQGAVIFAASMVIGLVVVGIYKTDGNNVWWRTYSYLVDFWLVAVIPIALYPFFGGKLWCRYWCPLAAYNQILAKWFGKLKIVSNKSCIQCTECSKYCQVGVDVMMYAKNQQPFDNSNTACIQCGICVDVCPMDVLSFESSKTKATQLISEGRSSDAPV